MTSAGNVMKPLCEYMTTRAEFDLHWAVIIVICQVRNDTYNLRFVKMGHTYC